MPFLRHLLEGGPHAIDHFRRAMTIAASYLPAGASERDPTHFVPELSRRARGFATWAMLAHLGREGVAEMVERHCRQARLIADRLRAEPGVQVLNDVVLNQIALRFGGEQGLQAGDRATRALLERVVQDGECYVGGAAWRGQWIMRLSVVNAAAQDADAERTARAIAAAWGVVRGD